MTAKNTPATFTKANLLLAKRYQQQRDLLHAILTDGQSYSHEEVKRLIAAFTAKGVN